MSKSLGNGIVPEDIIKQYGADVLRLWVASSDYHADIRISPDILKQLSEVYRKIRNTARYILGNLYDFDPNRDMVADDQLFELDRWALTQLDSLIGKVRDAYDHFEFHLIYHAVRNFCVIDMSNFYLDILKDRLYVEKPDSLSRRAAQTAIYRILSALTRMLAPILAFTADEIWKFLPHLGSEDSECVMFNDMPSTSGLSEDSAFMTKWNRIKDIREDVNKALELARKQKVIGKSLEAKVTLGCEGELYDFLKSVEKELTTAFIVSAVEIVNTPSGDFAGDVEGLKVTISKADGEKCERCWTFSNTVGQDIEHPTLCSRCAAIIKE